MPGKAYPVIEFSSGSRGQQLSVARHLVQVLPENSFVGRTRLLQKGSSREECFEKTRSPNWDINFVQHWVF